MARWAEYLEGCEQSENISTHSFPLGEISGSHGSEYEDDSPGMLRHVVCW
jgi:hypothetical protein